MSLDTHESLSLKALGQPEFLADPFPLYKRIRIEDPVYWDAPLRRWVLTRYDDVVAALQDPRFSANYWPHPESFQGRGKEPLTALFGMLTKQFAFRDPPDHTRLRGVVNKTFTSRAIQSLRPRIQEILDRLLDSIVATGQMDVIADLAYPLPATVTCEMLGVPVEDQLPFKQWSDDITHSMHFKRLPRQMVKAQQSIHDFQEYVRQACERSRKDPRNDLLNVLVSAADEGGLLSPDELVVTTIFMIIAGHEASTNLIGNGLLALLRNPAQWQELQRDPGSAPSAVEELLRYDSPTQFLGRIVLEDLELGGKQLKRGQGVIILLGAANRDPARFPDPDRLDLKRENNRHLAFSSGIHFCLGAPLARLEGEITFNTLARRLPDLRLAAETLEWRDYLSQRGLKSLPVVFNPRV